MARTFTFEPNIAHKLYNHMCKTKVRNLKFNAAFVNKLPLDDYFSRTTWKIIGMATNKHDMKCACCESSTAYYLLKKEDGIVRFKPYVDTANGRQALTVDHDILKSMGGSNNITNFNLLCEACNQLRGSCFARYDAFKDWYDAQDKVDGKVLTQPEQNYCHIDFLTNAGNGNASKVITGATVLPPNVLKPIVKSFRRGECNVFQDMSIRVFLLLDRTYANELLNKLVWERMYHGSDMKHLEVRNHNFFNDKLADHRKIKLHIENQINIQIRVSKKLHAAWLAEQEAKVKEEVKTVNTGFTFMGIVNKIVKIFA